MTTCPEECKTDRTKITDRIDNLFKISISPRAQQIVVYLIGILFASITFIFIFSVTTYATKEDLKETKIDLKAEIQNGFNMLELKLSKNK